MLEARSSWVKVQMQKKVQASSEVAEKLVFAHT